VRRRWRLIRAGGSGGAGDLDFLHALEKVEQLFGSA